MAFLSLKMVAPSPPFSGTNNESIIKRRTELRAVRTHLQVRSERVIEQQPNCPKSLTTSRRDTMLAGVSLAAITLFSTDSAEARIVNPEIRRKIFEKLKMLREKAGLSKAESKDKKSADGKKKPPSSEHKQKPPSAEHKHESPSAEDKQNSPSAKDKQKSPSPPPSTTSSKEKMPEPAKQETPPSPIPKNSQKGHLVEATIRK